MTDWLDAIRDPLSLGVHRLLLVADPDGLLLNPQVMDVIHQRNYHLLPYDDPVAFRYEYEARFRTAWDRGENRDVGLVVRLPLADLNTLPYDLLQIGHQITLGLAEIFPNLSYPVIAQLAPDRLNDLYKAYHRQHPSPMGETATKDFILTHVFDLDPDAINEPEELLGALLRIHYQRLPLSPILEQELLRRLRRKDQFSDWPLETLIADREAFFGFLQERWPIFLQRLAMGERSAFYESVASMDMHYPGPTWLPLDDSRVRVYVDTLFVEGVLHPIPFSKPDQLGNSWVTIGIETSPQANRLARLQKLLPVVATNIPDVQASHSQWFQFAYRWAELTTLILTSGASLPPDIHQTYNELISQVDVAILKWAKQRYQTLIHLPPSPPVMLHHIPRYLAHILEDDPKARIALLVLDLSLIHI